MKLLVISTVWVEPSSTAAGSRMLQLLHLFLDLHWEITYASTAAISEHAFDLSELSIKTAQIVVNDASFDSFVRACSPDVVLFDRFIAEEQFGWRIDIECPRALKLLDTEDLHCLRKARELAIKREKKFHHKDLVSDVAKREVAAIYRCDLTLMISTYEIHLLETFFKVAQDLLCYLPFLLQRLDTVFTDFDQREHFVSIGNFLHPPNWDATRQLKNRIWPLIRKELPQAELHVYGAYASEKVLQLNAPKEGFFIKGRAENAHDVIRQSKVLLAPLRFGAGLKGKFIDAMQCGTPSVTTVIGAEAMHEGLDWAGEVVDEEYAFAKAAIALYQNQETWQEAQERGRIIINSLYQKADFQKDFMTRIELLLANLEAHRIKNFTGQMLRHHTMRSTLFMSKWIEAKSE